MIPLTIDIPKRPLTETSGPNKREQPKKSLQVRSPYKQNPPLREIRKNPEVPVLCYTAMLEKQKTSNEVACILIYFTQCMAININTTVAICTT